MKVAFITHYCTHYRVKTYETLARYVDVDFYFYSQGDEWYWLDEHGIEKGVFNYGIFRASHSGVPASRPHSL